jgi:hypothetical protein
MGKQLMGISEVPDTAGTAAGAGPAKRRKPWAPPQVILSAVRPNTLGGANPYNYEGHITSGGGGTTTPVHS